MPDECGPLHILLTHLHLDHIQGLMFFAPLFHPRAEIVIWGPAAPEALAAKTASRATSPRRCRRSRCGSCPATCPSARRRTTEWQIGPATVRAASVTHRGPTLGYRITEGDDLALLHPRPRAGARRPARGVDPEWISGFELAHGASLLVHDCQYTRRGVPEPHRLGALAGLRRARLRPPRRARAAAALPPRPAALATSSSTPSRGGGRALGGAGRSAGRLEMATERLEVELTADPGRT